MFFTVWRTRRFHSSYGIGWMCLGLLIGLALSLIVRVEMYLVLVLIISIVMIVAIAKGRWFSLVIVVLCAILIGISRGSDMAGQLAVTQKLADEKIVVIGKIADDPQKSKRGGIQFVLGDLQKDGKHLAGNLWVTVSEGADIKRGDSVQLAGKARAGFGQYTLTMSYANIISIVRPNDPIRDIRDSFASSLRRYVVEPAASLGIGFVVGQRSSLPVQLDDQLRIVGLTHIVVASGYNLTILVRFAKRLFERYSKYLVAMSSGFLIIGFIAFSGLSPSMVRAGLVAGLSLLAWYYGRTFHPLLLILYVAATTAMISPLYLWYDIGWWLSFLAFFGVLITSPIIVKTFFKQKQPPSVVQLLVETVSAQIMTLPIILLVFGKMPMLALVANICTAPFVPLAMMLSAVAGVWGMCVPVLGAVVAVPAEIILSYFIAIVNMLSAPEWAQIDISLSPASMTVAYSCIAGLLIGLWRWKKINLRAQNIVE